MVKFLALVLLVCFIANVQSDLEVTKNDCSPDKLVPGPEFDAVKEVISVC